MPLRYFRKLKCGKLTGKRLIYCQKAPRLMCYSFLMNFANKEGKNEDPPIFQKKSPKRR